MSHDLSITPVLDAGAVTVPDSGDARTAASVGTPFQTLANRVGFAANTVASRIAWADEMSMAPGGSNSSFSLTIGAIQAISLARSDGSYRSYSANAATIGASKIEGGGNLANSTWYYVYAYDNAGAVDYLISTTAPRASRVYRNSVDGNQYRYLGCFVTDSSGAPVPFRMHRGRYTFRLSSAANTTRVLNSGTAQASATDVSLAAWIPSHARVARVQAIVTSSGGATLMILLTKGDADVSWRQQSADGTTTYGETDIETDSSRVIQYTYNLGGGTGNASIRVAGFYE
jgi:hypothetical protein